MENSHPTDENTLKFPTYSYSKCPIFGAFFDYVDSSFEYIKEKRFIESEKMHARQSRSRLSTEFLTVLCLVLGLVSNVKFEVATYSAMEMLNDLHFVITSTEEKLYVDDIDLSVVNFIMEAADVIAVLISCSLIWLSGNLCSPLSEYSFLPWLGVTLRGLLARQAATAVALAYVYAVAEEDVRPAFCVAYTLLCFVEMRIWLDMMRLVRSRWQRYNLEQIREKLLLQKRIKVDEPLADSELPNIQSVEVKSYLY